MSARVAWNGTGLVGALRSMNVSREDPEPWTLEALICSTKTPRTCAVSAPSAVAPARGICDSGRPARSPLSVSLAGRTRKPLPRPSGVSMPCAPGWPVWSVARRGGERPNRHCAVPHRTHECKGDYASSVKEIMPLEPGPVSESLKEFGDFSMIELAVRNVSRNGAVTCPAVMSVLLKFRHGRMLR